jgi:hypothetical protein
VKQDKTEQSKLLKKIEKLYTAKLRPAGISDDGTSFGCKFCDMKAVCTKEVEPLKHCRSCSMCVPGQEGKWVCELNNDTLSIERQRQGCEHYEAL